MAPPMVSEPDETQQQMQQLRRHKSYVVSRCKTTSDESANQTPGSKPRAADIATTRPKNTHHTHRRMCVHVLCVAGFWEHHCFLQTHKYNFHSVPTMAKNTPQWKTIVHMPTCDTHARTMLQHRNQPSGSFSRLGFGLGMVIKER